MKCPACKITDLVKTKTKRNGFHMEYCPDCKGIWFEQIEIERILLKLDEVGIPAESKPVPEDKKQIPVQQNHSPILDSIYAGKELHYLHNLKSKPHWIHRFFG